MFKPVKINISKSVVFVFLLSAVVISVIALALIRRRETPPGNIETETVSVPESEGPVENPSEEFPETFPVYKTATVSGSWSKTKDTTKATSVVFESKDAVLDVYDFYLNNLEANGWIIKDKKESKDFYSISFEKDLMSGFLGITKSSFNKTIISVTITSKI